MCIDRLPRTEMYVEFDIRPSSHRLLFSRDRFKHPLRFFRVAAPDDDAAPRNPLPHILSLAVKLNAAFETHFIPSRELALDEAMAAFKGRSPIKQYIPSKPHKWDIRFTACRVLTTCSASKSMLAQNYPARMVPYLIR